MRNDADQRQTISEAPPLPMAPAPLEATVPKAARATKTADGLRLMHFRTVGLDEPEAQQAYLDRLDGILDTRFLAPFEAEVDAYSMGPFSVLCATATARRSARLPARIAHDRYDSIGVQYIVAGRAAGEANGRPLTSGPDSIMLLDYGQPFAVVDQETRVVVNVAVPRVLFPHGDRPSAAWHGTILRGGTAAPLAGFLRQLHDALAHMPRAAGLALAAAFTQLLTVALGSCASGDSTGADHEARIVARAALLVDGRIGSADLDPHWLAAKLGLSRSELYATMERFGGVARFIMQRRLNGAHAALADVSDTRRIGAIGYAFGFSSEAHFSRAFRTAFGETPSTVRRQASANA